MHAIRPERCERLSSQLVRVSNVGLEDTTHLFDCVSGKFLCVGCDAIDRDDKRRSRIKASLAVNSTQMLAAVPVRMTVLTPRYSSSVSRVVEKNPECFGFKTK